MRTTVDGTGAFTPAALDTATISALLNGQTVDTLTDGIRIERTVGNTILRFKSKSDGTAEIAGELLSALMR